MDSRWLHVLERADALARVVDSGGLGDDGQVWAALAESLADLEVVFPRELDPVGDLAGFALRYYVRALTRAVDQLRHGEASPDAVRARGAVNMNTDPIYVTEKDIERLEAVLSGMGANGTAALLENELARARVVPSEMVPADVVTMNSRVRFVDVRSGEAREVTLVYPNAANIEMGRVSVLAPVGAALLGLAVGDEIDWPMPAGDERRLRVVAVPFQPEAAGRFDL